MQLRRWYFVLLLCLGGAMPLGAQSSSEVSRPYVTLGGKKVSIEEIDRRVKDSGLSQAELRAQAEAMGHDPKLIDEYFDRKNDRPASSEAEGSSILRAMQALGSVLREVPESPMAQDTQISIPGDSAAPGGGDLLTVFGRDLFALPTNPFESLVTGPVDSFYPLGPGDEVVVMLTGDMEVAHTLTVSREGLLVVPEAGSVPVAGLTLEDASQLLAGKLDRVYSGVSTREGAAIRLQLLLGRLRTNQVFIVGAVSRPGAYQVSSVATVFNALYQAGGPSDQGSFRQVVVRRGGSVFRTVDLYRYLLHGDSRDDVRLQQGDILYVPIAKNQVRVEGSVRRPAIYEFLPGEGVADVVSFAGGLNPDAVANRVLVDRILPPEDRTPGRARVLVDVGVSALSGQQKHALAAGDRIRVLAMHNDRVRNRVMVGGEVRRPGDYEWTQGMTLADLIRRAEGLHESAYTPRAHIYRLNERDGSRTLIRTEIELEGNGQPRQDIRLADRDSVVVYSRESLRTPQFVWIDGWVKKPGQYAYARGMSIKDLILAAGGFREGADMGRAEVSRRPDPATRSDTLSQIQVVQLGIGYEDPESAHLPEWSPEAEEAVLQDGDHVFVRAAPGYSERGVVRMTGEVMYPGAYVLQTRQERLLDVLTRAGGLTPEAHAPGLQLVREGHLVATDLPEAQRKPQSAFNISLLPGDSIHLPRYDGTVLVTGAVTFESRVLFKAGASLGYYIDRAGGFAANADRSRITVTYQDGERKSITRRFIFWDAYPVPQAGSTVHVTAINEAERSPFNWDKFLTRTLGVVSAVAGVLVAVK